MRLTPGKDSAKSEVCNLKLTTGAEKMQVLVQGILTEGEGSLSTVDLLIKIACFVKRTNNIFIIKGS